MHFISSQKNQKKSSEPLELRPGGGVV